MQNITILSLSLSSYTPSPIFSTRARSKILDARLFDLCSISFHNIPFLALDRTKIQKSLAPAYIFASSTVSFDSVVYNSPFASTEFGVIVSNCVFSDITVEDESNFPVIMYNHNLGFFNITNSVIRNCVVTSGDGQVFSVIAKTSSIRSVCLFKSYGVESQEKVSYVQTSDSYFNMSIMTMCPQVSYDGTIISLFRADSQVSSSVNVSYSVLTTSSYFTRGLDFFSNKNSSVLYHVYDHVQIGSIVSSTVSTSSSTNTGDLSYSTFIVVNTGASPLPYCSSVAHHLVFIDCTFSPPVFSPTGEDVTYRECDFSGPIPTASYLVFISTRSDSAATQPCNSLVGISECIVPVQTYCDTPANKLGGWAIFGIVMGSLVGAVLIAVGGYFLWKWWKNREDDLDFSE